MNGLPEIIAREYVYITSLSDDILFIIMCMVFNFSDFIECYKIGNINKQFYRIVLFVIPTLTRINFYNTTFTWQITLEKILKKTKNITTLDLSSNNYVYACDIARVLKYNSTLTTLILSNTNIGRYGCVIPFTEALKTNTTLTTLDLSCNKAGDWMIAMIAEALKINSTLTTLNFSYNDVGYDGAKAIA